jgi:cyclophilin family peptidyl-prolyl cis-trans isomerase
MWFLVVLRLVFSEPKVTHKAFLDISINSTSAGRIVLGLYGEVAPKTVENFVHHVQCDIRNETTGILKCYNGSKFHRAIRGFMVQAGDYVKGNGGFSESIWGGLFADETFDIELKGPGVLAMANSARNANGCQFFITLKATPWLEGKHVGFGRVLSGLKVVEQISLRGTKKGRPLTDIVIANCGLF